MEKRLNETSLEGAKMSEAHFKTEDFFIISTLKLNPQAVPYFYNISDFENRPPDVLRNFEELINENYCLKETIKNLRSDVAKMQESYNKVLEELNNQKGKLNAQEAQVLDSVLPKNLRSWDNESIEKTFIIKFACGSSGYETLLKLNYPLPSSRTLRRKIEHIKFQPGTLFEILHYLKLKMDCLNEYERDCSLYMDEMSITPGKSYCAALSKNLGEETLQGSSEVATHALVIMLGGINIRWKQVILYHFTANSIDVLYLAEHLKEIIVLISRIGFNIVNVTTDMGPTNQA